MPKKEEGISSEWNDPDDAPKWTDDQLGRAELRQGDEVVRPSTGTLTKPGRPKMESPKQQVTLRLDPEVLEHFRAGGAGWQTRINEVLKKAMGA